MIVSKAAYSFIFLLLLSCGVSASITDNLVSCYNFEVSSMNISNLDDVFDNNILGKFPGIGGGVDVPGLINRSGEFNINTGYSSNEFPASPINTTSPFFLSNVSSRALSFWFNASPTTDANGSIFYDRTDTGFMQFSTLHALNGSDPTPKWGCSWSNTSTASITIDLTSVINFLEWNHVVMSYNGSHGFCYHNSSLVGSVFVGSLYNRTDLLTTPGGFSVGNTDLPFTAFLDGDRIDEFFVYSDSLDVSDVVELYNNHSGVVCPLFVPVVPPPDFLVVGECPDNLTKSSIVLLFVVFGCFLCVVGFFVRIALAGILGGIVLMIMSWLLVSCESLMGWIFALLSFFVLLWFAIRFLKN